MNMQHYDNCHGNIVGTNKHHQNIPVDFILWVVGLHLPKSCHYTPLKAPLS